MKRIIFLLLGVVLFGGSVCFAEEDSDKLDLYIKAGDGTYIRLPVGSDVIISQENFTTWANSDTRFSKLSQTGTAYFIGNNDEKYLLITQDMGNHKIVKFIKKTKDNQSWFNSDAWSKKDAKYDFQKKFKSYADYGK